MKRTKRNKKIHTLCHRFLLLTLSTYAILFVLSMSMSTLSMKHKWIVAHTRHSGDKRIHSHTHTHKIRCDHDHSREFKEFPHDEWKWKWIWLDLIFFSTIFKPKFYEIQTFQKFIRKKMLNKRCQFYKLTIGFNLNRVRLFWSVTF